jgi:hypothetical protein
MRTGIPLNPSRWLAPVLALTLMACGGGSSKPPVAPEPVPEAAPPVATSTATCEAVVTKMVDNAPELFAALPAERQGVWRTRLSESFTISCKEDKWSPELLDCVTAATDKAAIDACGAKVTQPQQEALMKRVEPLVQELTAEIQAAKAAADKAAQEEAQKNAAAAEPAKEEPAKKAPGKKGKKTKGKKAVDKAEAAPAAEKPDAQPMVEKPE